MPRMRTTVRTLLAIVAVLALLLAAMRSGSLLATSLFSTAGLVLLLTAILGAVFCRGERRAFWSGFALFGWVYLILVNWDWVGGQFGHDLTAVFSSVAESFFPDPADTSVTAGTQGSLNRFPVPIEQLRERTIRIGSFVQMVRLSVAIGLGIVGGGIARKFQREQSVSCASTV